MDMDKEPEPRPPFPGDWYPEMAERGLSLWAVRMTCDLRDPERRLHVARYEQLMPTVRVLYEPIRDVSDGTGPILQLHGWVINQTPAGAIETMMANVRWIEQEEPPARGEPAEGGEG